MILLHKYMVQILNIHNYVLKIELHYTMLLGWENGVQFMYKMVWAQGQIISLDE